VLTVERPLEVPMIRYMDVVRRVAGSFAVDFAKENAALRAEIDRLRRLEAAFMSGDLKGV
jgi:hypothetical protein